MNFPQKIWQCFFEWKCPKADTSTDIRNADVVIGLSCGFRVDGPGLTNEALAKVITKLQRLRPLPLILQKEIALCLPDLPETIVISEHRFPDKYLHTHEVLSQAKKICEERGWKKAIIIAHPYHYWRALRTTEKLGLGIITMGIEEIPPDEKSVHPWTRRNWRIFVWEIVMRFFFLLRRWI